MGRWTQYDEDSYRLPAGMVRTGYDADTGCYTFRDATGTYTGQPGSHYGPMYPVGTSPAPRRTLVTGDPQLPSELEQSPDKSRRATFPDVPGVLRSLRRSLTTTRKPWRHDHSSDSDEEPVLVSRPHSPLQSEDSVPSASRSSATVRGPTSSTKAKGHSRSVSTSAARSASHTGHSRRTASEHVHTAPLPIAARFMTTTSPSTPSSPAAPGTAPKPQKLPSNRRHASEQTPSSPASEQTPSSPASARSTSASATTASPRPRSSAPLSRSVSTSTPSRTSEARSMSGAPERSKSSRKASTAVASSSSPPPVPPKDRAPVQRSTSPAPAFKAPRASRAMTAPDAH